ncbi:MAG: hypothetical protein HXS47_01360 [Theionarchaea archaeon]|nr:hypothetical protein [Theionarchaea archaeon]
MERLKKKIIYTAAVGIITAVSFFIMYSTTENYIQATRATHQLGGELVALEFEGEDVVNVTFNFHNTSTLDIYLQKIAFNLYANGRFLGNYDMREKTLLPPGETQITITAKIHRIYMEGLRSEKEYTENLLWVTKGGAVIELPFKGMTISVDIIEYWVT